VRVCLSTPSLGYPLQPFGATWVLCFMHFGCYLCLVFHALPTRTPLCWNFFQVLAKSDVCMGAAMATLSICSFLAQTELGVLYHATLRQCRCEISDRTCALSPYEFGAVTVQASDLRSDVRAVRFGEIGRHRHTI